jgi:hypothetical protein
MPAFIVEISEFRLKKELQYHRIWINSVALKSVKK